MQGSHGHHNSIPTLYIHLWKKLQSEEYSKKYKKNWKCKRVQQVWYSMMDNNQAQYRFFLRARWSSSSRRWENLWSCCVLEVQSIYDFPLHFTRSNFLFYFYNLTMLFTITYDDVVRTVVVLTLYICSWLLARWHHMNFSVDLANPTILYILINWTKY